MAVNLGSDQQELVDLLRNELAELIEHDVAGLVAEGGDAWRAALTELQQHLDSVGNAAELAGLFGLRDSCHHLANNFGCLSSAAGMPGDECLAALQFWGIYLLSYLQALGDDDASAQAVADLLMFLADPIWPAPLFDEDAQRMGEQFAATDLGIDDSPQDALPQTVTDEMLSLSAPPDVRPELLQGLLVELPEQVRQLEGCTASYLTSRNLSSLATVQRLAHTIKGSANVVGIPGLANLMHYTEDLLENVSRKNASLAEDFDALLQDTVDCFAAMAEAVAGIGSPPADARQIMIRLIDWLRQLRENKSPTASEVSEPEAVYEVEAASQEPAQVEVVAAEKEPQQMLTIPDTLAHELLRLIGETQITNTQAFAQIDELADSVKAAVGYHRHIKTMSSELEHLLEMQGAMGVASAHAVGDQMDPLELERYNELHSFSHKLLELATDAQESLERMAQQVKSLRGIAFGQQQLNKDSQQLVLELRMVPVKTMRSRFVRCVRQASRMTGKRANLILEGEHILMDSRVLHQVVDPVMHLLRNAVDHGLETPEEREHAGKAEEGQIHLSFAQAGEIVVIQCRDDGRGLDYNRIAEVARRHGLADDDFLEDPDNLNQLIMMPGFSTRDAVSQTSGRGIGLDAVVAQIKELKGNVVLESEPGQGACFTLTVPTSILSGHAVQVRTRGSSGDHMLCIVTRSIEQILYLAPGELTLDVMRNGYELDNEKIPLFELNDLTQIHLSRRDFDDGALLVMRKSDGSRCAVLVESVLASQDLVIKPLGRFSCKPPGVVGATILGNGAVAPVVDLQELPGLGLTQDELERMRSQRAKLAQESGLHGLQEKPMALVVDDSLSARRSLAQFVADLGMDVRTARDGFEAISVIEQQRPVLMLVDLEMPRMNGLELTSHIRSKEATRDIPVIMITSRSTEKHRRLAASAGVNSYLSKPWSEDELMSLIQQQIA